MCARNWIGAGQQRPNSKSRIWSGIVGSINVLMCLSGHSGSHYNLLFPPNCTLDRIQMNCCMRCVYRFIFLGVDLSYLRLKPGTSGLRSGLQIRSRSPSSLVCPSSDSSFTGGDNDVHAGLEESVRKDSLPLNSILY